MHTKKNPGNNVSISPDRFALEEEIDGDIEKYLFQFPTLKELFAYLRTAGPIALFGGFVRDRIHKFVHREAIRSRDVDLVVDGPLPARREGEQQNNFGGRRCAISAAVRVDYWELRSTYAFRKGLFAATLENLPKTTVYTANACVFDLQRRQLTDHHAVEHIARRAVAFNCRSYLDVFPDYQAFRAIELAARLGYAVDHEVSQFVKSRFNLTPWASFVAAVQQHRPDLTADHLRAICEPYR